MNFNSLPHTLNAIANAQLIRRSDEKGADNAYWFKHALVQDTAYASLMRHDRKRLHRLVAETLERVYPERATELAPRLAEHFDEAGETARALFYFERAAESAAARYANREALDFYTRALDAAEELQTETRDSLYRARGVVYERIGNFDAACADLERALEIARATNDAHAEWQSLMGLGFAWTARDYARAGEYFEKALALARASNDAAHVAHTLNRVGNWYVNNDEPPRAAAYHAEALEIFERLNDARGVAETQDLLSMRAFLAGDYLTGERHAQAALRGFAELHDAFGQTNTTIASYLIYSLLQGNTLALAEAWRERGLDEKLASAVRATRQLEWRAGEAFALLILGEGFASDGQYGRAFELLERGIDIANEIHHRQWRTATTLLYGAALAHLLNFERALPYLENALRWARELASMNWIRTSSGFLASALIAQNELTRAAEILDAAMPPDTPAQSIGQRQVWAARAELALAQNDAARAHAALDVLMRDAANVTPTTVIPRLWLVRARVFMLQNEIATAEALARAAFDNARTTNQPAWEWRSAAALAQLYHAQGRGHDAERETNTAREIVMDLAQTLSEESLRAVFVARAMEQSESA